MSKFETNPNDRRRNIQTRPARFRSLFRFPDFFIVSNFGFRHWNFPLLPASAPPPNKSKNLPHLPRTHPMPLGHHPHTQALQIMLDPNLPKFLAQTLGSFDQRRDQRVREAAQQALPAPG